MKVIRAREGWVIFEALSARERLVACGITPVSSGVAQVYVDLFALVKELKTCRVHLSDEQAIAALQREPLYDPDEGFYAHMALRQQLIAMNAMEDDL